MVDEGTGIFRRSDFDGGGVERHLGPALAPDQGEGIGEGGEELELPRRSANRDDHKDLEMGEACHQGEEAE